MEAMEHGRNHHQPPYCVCLTPLSAELNICPCDLVHTCNMTWTVLLHELQQLLSDNVIPETDVLSIA